MKIILSPAKNINEQIFLNKETSIPIFEKEANILVKDLKKIKKLGLQELMGISNDLAEQNLLRFKQWKKASLDPSSALMAMRAFSGEVYRGFNIESLDEKHFGKLNEQIRILSGLYGILKPFDLIHPYRLEMGTNYSPKPDQKNLYEFWGDKVTKALKKELSKEEVIINLASSEYSKVIQQKLLKNKIITPVFKEFKEGKYTIVSMYAKHARGAMARYLIETDLNDVENLKLYQTDGYRYDDLQSTATEWVFTR
jgi:cytoplasmic iron level regulating protein YaaA (DUF328/UPF0246 family)